MPQLWARLVLAYLLVDECLGFGFFGGLRHRAQPRTSQQAQGLQLHNLGQPTIGNMPPLFAKKKGSDEDGSPPSSKKKPKVEAAAPAPVVSDPPSRPRKTLLSKSKKADPSSAAKPADKDATKRGGLDDAYLRSLGLDSLGLDSLGMDDEAAFSDLEIEAMFDDRGKLKPAGQAQGKGKGKDLLGLPMDMDLDLDLDLDEEAMLKMGDLFPLDEMDEENEKELAEALRGIEDGNFDLSDFLAQDEPEAEAKAGDRGDARERTRPTAAAVAKGILQEEGEGDFEEGEEEEGGEDNVDMIGDVDLFAELDGGARRREDSDLEFDVVGGEGEAEEEEVDRDDDGAKERSSRAGPASRLKPPTKVRKGRMAKGAGADTGEDVPLTELGAGSTLPPSELPPLEEFRRLMESLGPDSLFDDEGLFDEEEEVDEEMVLAGKQRRLVEGEEVTAKLEEGADGEVLMLEWTAEDGTPQGFVQYNGEDLPLGPLLPRIDGEEDPYFDAFAPNIYEGGRMQDGFDKFGINSSTLHQARLFNRYLYLNEPDEPMQARVKLVSVVTNSSANSTALQVVNTIYDFVRRGVADHLDRIDFETHVYSYGGADDDAAGEGVAVEAEDETAVEELEGMVQMWLEGYNTYHLVDGYAMREAWGSIMPHIALGEKNMQAILDQVRWALNEDELGGALLSPRMRRIRVRGGAQEMIMGYNTEELDVEFSTVSVR